MQPAFIVIDKYAGGNMHRIYKADAFFNWTFSDTGLDLWRDINKFLNIFSIKPQILGIGFHERCLAGKKSILGFFGLKKPAGKLFSDKVVKFFAGEDIDIGPAPKFGEMPGNGAGFD